MDWVANSADMRDQLRELHRAIPAARKGFSTLTKATKDAGPLDMKTKELVALGISIAMRCDPCIGFHVEALSKAGGTREDLGDMLGIAIQMGGGPSLMYAAKTLAAWDQLNAQ